MAKPRARTKKYEEVFMLRVKCVAKNGLESFWRVAGMFRTFQSAYDKACGFKMGTENGDIQTYSIESYELEG